MDSIKIIATTTFGMEAVCKRELKALGFEKFKTENGRIEVEGEMADIPMLNIWLRTAERIRWKIAEFKALSFETLFNMTKDIDWCSILPEGASFPVEGKSVKSTLFSISDCQRIVKKAIVESLKEERHGEWIEESGPEYKIEVSILNDIVTLSIDTTGRGLHRRGYRGLIGTAPLKETMAAGMILLSYWNEDRLLWDPFCGSGTIPIEAAMIAKNIAPGLKRGFVSEEWDNFPEGVWEEVREEAESLIEHDLKLKIVGTDIDEDMIKIAKENARKAGVLDDIDFYVQDVNEFKTDQEYGVMISNPPYGERLEEVKSVEKLYKKIREIKNKNMTWSYYILTSYEKFEKIMKKEADRRRKLYNGNIKTNYYQYYGPRPPRDCYKSKEIRLNTEFLCYITRKNTVLSS